MNELTKEAFALMDEAETELLSGNVDDELTTLTLRFQALRENYDAAKLVDYFDKSNFKELNKQ